MSELQFIKGTRCLQLQLCSSVSLEYSSLNSLLYFRKLEVSKTEWDHCYLYYILIMTLSLICVLLSVFSNECIGTDTQKDQNTL